MESEESSEADCCFILSAPLFLSAVAAVAAAADFAVFQLTAALYSTETSRQNCAGYKIQLNKKGKVARK